MGTVESLANQIGECLSKHTLGCVLLCSLEPEGDNQLKIKDILAVREFPKVFRPKIETLPPKREIEFSIDLLSSSGQISIAPYRMLPLELS